MAAKQRNVYMYMNVDAVWYECRSREYIVHTYIPHG